MSLMAAVIDRFWSKVIKGPASDDCWIWVGAIADDGYGRFWIKEGDSQIVVRPHRYAYALACGIELDSSMVMMHVCDVPLCVHATLESGSHIVAGDQWANIADRQRKRRFGNSRSLRMAVSARQSFQQNSLALRDELLTHGWRDRIVRPLLAGYDPEAPTLF